MTHRLQEKIELFCDTNCSSMVVLKNEERTVGFCGQHEHQGYGHQPETNRVNRCREML